MKGATIIMISNERSWLPWFWKEVWKLSGLRGGFEGEPVSYASGGECPSHMSELLESRKVEREISEHEVVAFKNL